MDDLHIIVPRLVYSKFKSAFLLTIGAENETRTRDPNLGKVVLYQLSYFRIFPERDCKGTKIFFTSKFFRTFFQKICKIFEKTWFFAQNRPSRGGRPVYFE